MYASVIKNKSIHFRRRRQILLFITSAAFSLFLCITAIQAVYRQIHKYEAFLQYQSLNSVPFWQDNRTMKNTRLFPIRKIEEVNLSNSSIVIVACARDVEKYIENFRKNMRKITNLFQDYQILIYESESKDNTRKLLYTWRYNDPDHMRLLIEGRSVFSRSLSKVLLP